MLDAASQLFYDRGINSVGVDTIASEAGVTKKTLYDQFGSKAALVAAYLTERDQRYRAWVEERIEAEVGANRVLAVFDALNSWMDEHSPTGCPFVHAHGELLASPEHPAHDVIRAEKAWERELFAELARDAGCREPVALAAQLTSLLEGATVLRSISEVHDAFDESRRAADVLVAAQAAPAR